MEPAPLPPRAEARARLALAEETTRRIARLREVHGIAPLLFVWGAVIIAGNFVTWYLSRRGAASLIEPAWLAITTLAIVVTGLFEWRRSLHSLQVWRLWGLMLLLLLHGWSVTRLLVPATPRAGALFATGVILTGWAAVAVLFNARRWFIFSLLLNALAFAGYFLFPRPLALCLWLAGAVGGAMLLAAAASLWWQARLSRVSSSPGEAGDD